MRGIADPVAELPLFATLNESSPVSFDQLFKDFFGPSRVTEEPVERARGNGRFVWEWRLR